MTERTLFILILIALLLLFIFQNTQAIAVRFLFWKVHLSLALWLILPFLIGLLLGAFVFRAARKKSEQSKK
jgi:uncharacterized integral membrane protein